MINILKVLKMEKVGKYGEVFDYYIDFSFELVKIIEYIQELFNSFYLPPLQTGSLFIQPVSRTFA
jgi:hypothetical protein